MMRKLRGYEVWIVERLVVDDKKVKNVLMGTRGDACINMTPLLRV